VNGHEGIEQFQFVQTGPGSMVLRLCARQDVADVVGLALQSRLQADLGSVMALEVERVDSIPRSRSGKHCSVIGLPAE
jgi:hypothetical protein